jgi:hypothetical protein
LVVKLGDGHAEPRKSSLDRVNRRRGTDRKEREAAPGRRGDGRTRGMAERESERRTSDGQENGHPKRGSQRETGKLLGRMGLVAGQNTTSRRAIVLKNKYCGLQATVECETKAAVEEAPHAKSTQKCR